MIGFGVALALLLAPPAQPQDPPQVRADEPTGLAVDGGGRDLRFVCGHRGQVWIWARSDDLELVLRVTGADGATLAENSDAGGLRMPFAELEVGPGHELLLHLAAREPGASGATTLCVVELPETEATRAAASEAGRLLQQAARDRASGDWETGRARADDAFHALRTVEGGERSPGVIEALLQVGRVARALSDLELARDAWVLRYEYLDALLPEGHLGAHRAARNVAILRILLGDPAGGLELLEPALAAHEAARPEDDHALLVIREDVAAALENTGDLDGARRLFEQNLAIRGALLEDDHPDLLRLRFNYADVLRQQLQFERARELIEQVVAVRERTLDPRAHELLIARNTLGSLLLEIDDLAGALAILEDVLAIREEILPEGSPFLQSTRNNLATARMGLGDVAGARVLLEQVVREMEARLPDGHPDLEAARGNLAVAVRLTGGEAHALEMEWRIYEARRAGLPPGHPDILRAGLALAHTMLGATLDDARQAAELIDALILDFEPSPYELGSLLTYARILRGNAELTLGDPEAACAIFRNVFAAPESAEYPYFLLSYGSALAYLGNEDELAEILPAIEDWLKIRLDACLTVSPREAREIARAQEIKLALYLSLVRTPTTMPERARRAFGFTEQFRSAATGEAGDWITRSDSESDTELRELGARALALREEIGHLAASADDAERELLAPRVLERDRIEARLRGQLVRTGRIPPAVDVAGLAAALPERSAAVAYRVYSRFHMRGERPAWEGPEEWLMAHVVGADGSLQRVELAPTAVVEAAVERWRAPLVEGTGRGVSAGEAAARSDGADELDAGADLRALALDPVLAAAGDVDRLHVCTDGALHLVPLDALPLEDGVVGDRVRLLREVSLGRLLGPRRAASQRAAFVGLGGIDYGEAPSADLLVAAAAAPVRRSAASPLAFQPLPETRTEVERIAELFEERHPDVEAAIRTGRDASRAALHDLAPRARFLHVATHGWFADESVASRAEPLDLEGPWPAPDGESTIVGLAPMTLCGLALAGAGLGLDSRGRARGIVTAEEIAGLDLAGCDLAVLSACETNVGVRRAGQGLQSLQTALHSAGARTAITSLWKVDDERTRELMVELYRGLWEDGLGPADALWAAKRRLRDDGAPLRDWAGWVLTGDPD